MPIGVSSDLPPRKGHPSCHDRATVASRCLAFRAPEQPDEILMHGAMIRPEPIDQRTEPSGRLHPDAPAFFLSN